MNVYTEVDIPGWERVVHCINKAAKFNSYIAIHNTKQGPSLGGCRMWPYQSQEEALTDVLRLSEGMTYKSIWAGLPLGGGKTVIIADPKRDKTEALFEAYGEFVEYLDGQYISGEDVGTTLEDLQISARKTNHIGSTHGSGDPSPMTAYACFKSIVETCYWKYGVTDISGLTVSILGVGKVGYELARLLDEAGVYLYVSDINQEAMDRTRYEFGAIVFEREEDLLCTKTEVFAPCALGGIINDDTIPLLNCEVIAGSANNQLLELRHGNMLHQKDILYAPDYVINAGGLINVYCELGGLYSAGRAKAMAGRISGNLINIYERSARENKPTYLVADEMAKEILNGGKNQISI